MYLIPVAAILGFVWLGVLFYCTRPALKNMTFKQLLD
jgi:nitrogen fixation-related uncharacterized protein